MDEEERTRRGDEEDVDWICTLYKAVHSLSLGLWLWEVVGMVKIS